MKSLKKIICHVITFFMANMALNTYALDQMAKEETTPPLAENALTTEQILPLYSTDKEKTQQALGTITPPSTLLADE